MRLAVLHVAEYLMQKLWPEVLPVNLSVAIRVGQVLYLDLLHGSFPGRGRGGGASSALVRRVT